MIFLAMEAYLKETYYFNFNHSTIQDYLDQTDHHQSQKEQAIDLYLKVRDGWMYNPYTFHTLPEHFQSSEIITRKQGHCLDKAVLLITLFRGVGLPARLHLAKVKNHIAVERIVAQLGTDELTPHGFVEVWLNQKWVACTPAFNQSLCQKLGVEVLEFDGEQDSVFQPYNQRGDVFMEYLEDYGTFEDFPYDFVLQNLEAHYPRFKSYKMKRDSFSFD